MTGRLGDGWLPSLSKALLEMGYLVDEAALEAGRAPADIRRVLNVAGPITDSPARELLVGPPQHWIEQRTDLEKTLGFDGFIFAPADDALNQIERFANDVVPGARAETVRRDATAAGLGEAGPSDRSRPTHDAVRLEERELWGADPSTNIGASP